MTKTKIKPVMLGILKVGDRFIRDGAEWEVLQQNWGKERDPHKGKAICKKVNTPAIITISRDNYVIPA